MFTNLQYKKELENITTFILKCGMLPERPLEKKHRQTPATDTTPPSTDFEPDTIQV